VRTGVVVKKRKKGDGLNLHGPVLANKKYGGRRRERCGGGNPRISGRKNPKKEEGRGSEGGISILRVTGCRSMLINCASAQKVLK